MRHTSQGLDKDLHPATQAQHQVQRGLLLDVVVGQGAAILQLLASKDQSLLVGRDALLVLDLGLHVVDGVVGLHFQCDGLPCKANMAGRFTSQMSGRPRQSNAQNS